MMCENCGSNHDRSYGSGRFCCERCARSFSSRHNIDNTSLIKEANCPKCGNTHKIKSNASPKQTLCYNCKPRKSVAPKKIQIQILLCLNCNNLKAKSKLSRNFCSNKCSCEYRKKKLESELVKDNGIGHNILRLKRYLINTNGHKCSICNNTTWMDRPIPLVLDHINGRADENNLDNLRLVCGNCDMQLPTYKSKNKNSARTKRAGHYI
ncbi:hypothetical protein JZU46_02990 [bacterium]|nr:hypothetical protein [bacterium]